jgi:GxxExxY protein
MSSHRLIDEELTYSVIGAFYEVYNALDFGYFEQAYVNALEIELRERGHHVAREVPIVVRYKGRVVARHRLDLLVDHRLIVETKSTAQLPPVTMRQLYSYLHASGHKVGLVLHFGPEPKHYRVVCDRARLRPEVDPRDPPDPPNPQSIT